jgi:hypothetical protein
MLRGRTVRWVAAFAGASLLFLAGFLLRPGTAAQTFAPPQLTVGQRADLAANILVKVPVTISCAPRSPDTLLTLSVTLEQGVSAGRIAHGQTGLSSNPTSTGGGAPFPSGVTCDSASHSFAIDVLADTGGAAFGDGASIVTATATVCTLQNFSQTDCQTTTAGPRVLSQVTKNN